MTEAGKLMLDIFDAIERRDEVCFARLVANDFEAVWPPSLPYGGTTRGLGPDGRTWSETWEPLQPTERQRRMSPRVVADAGDEVVVLWHQRRADRFGNELNSEVLGLYTIRQQRLARAQMFYFDPEQVARFLARAVG